MILPKPVQWHGEHVMSDEKYHGAEFAEYLSASRLKKLIGLSPLHASGVDAEPTNDSALVTGSAFHTLALRPADFAAEFVVAPAVDRRTKVGKAEWGAAEADAAASGRTLLKADEHATAAAIADAVRGNRDAVGLLEQCDRIERAYFALVDGVPAKAKPDAWVPGGPMIDLKSLGFRATDHKVASTAVENGWAIQAAWYGSSSRPAGFSRPDQVWFIVA